MKFSHYFFLISLLMASNLIAGCGRPADSAEKEAPVSIDGGAVGFALSLAVAEEYQRVHPEAGVCVATSGTGGGFSKFCAGNLDIAGASRDPERRDREMSGKRRGISGITDGDRRIGGDCQ